MFSNNDKGFGIKRISSITPCIAAVWPWAKTLHVYEIRFSYLRDINVWSKHEGNTQGSVARERRSQRVVADPQWTPQEYSIN